MKVTFRTKYRDLIAFNFFHVFRSPIFIGLLVFIIIIGIKPNWQAVMSIAADKSLFYRLLLFIILELVPIVFAYLFIALILLIGNISKLNRTILTDCSITFDDDVITTESAYSRSELQWTAINKLAQSRSHIFLYVMQHGAITIPKRAFNNVDEYNQFRAACQARLKT